MAFLSKIDVDLGRFELFGEGGVCFRGGKSGEVVEGGPVLIFQDEVVGEGGALVENTAVREVDLELRVCRGPRIGAVIVFFKVAETVVVEVVVLSGIAWFVYQACFGEPKLVSEIGEGDVLGLPTDVLHEEDGDIEIWGDVSIDGRLHEKVGAGGRAPMGDR